MDRVFVITGASSGIGAATARAAVAAGDRVVLAARSEDKLRALAEELGGDDVVVTQRCDVTRWEDDEALIARALDAFGAVDVVFANAGFGAGRGWLAESPEHWESMVATNVTGAAFCARAALPALKASRGHLLLTGSSAGRLVMPGSLYSVTKHAVHAMAEAIRTDPDLEGSGVRTTVIAPGMVDTPFFDERKEGALHADDVARAVMYAVDQPATVDVNEVVLRPATR